MKLKLIPKNEQELSKLFVLIFPLTLLFASFSSFLKDAYFTFANLIPNNKIFNYGFLDILNNQVIYGLLFAKFMPFYIKTSNFNGTFIAVHRI